MYSSSSTSSLKIICIGGGISGLYFAIKAAEFSKLTIYSKDELSESNSYHAKGGIAAPLGDEDSISSHINDTLLAGDGLCNENAVRFMIQNARPCIEDLVTLGTEFNKDKNQQFDLSREGGHSHNRVVHIKDETGKEVINRLIEIVRNHPNITIKEHHFVVDLITENSSVVGASILNTQSQIIENHYADITVLATGGAGNLYSFNTNPPSATGDGYALASRVGATMMNMEFVQFHPTMLYLPNREDNILISEALRGAGAQLKDSKGIQFMYKYHAMGSLAPRDIVSRSMLKEMQREGSDFLYLDATSIGEQKLREEFPFIYYACKKYDIDISKEMIRVVPAAHYICGGVTTDLDAKTSVNNLYAVGEVACTGVHGANRLASNSLLEGIVFASSAANSIKENLEILMQRKNTPSKEYSEKLQSNISKSSVVSKVDIQQLLWNNLGIVRTAIGMKLAEKKLSEWKQNLVEEIKIKGRNRQLYELLNMIETAILITSFALRRTENKGTHFVEESDVFLAD
ncbi:MAG: L-aspartate oxidase [Bacteroidetes bacterium]|nr:L-aspartate oxidase [Bacteroidota bacterium]